MLKDTSPVLRREGSSNAPDLSDYTRRLVHYLLGRQVHVWLEHALQIKRSIGLVRGKDDKVDAQRIARYALLQPDKANLLNLSGMTLEKLKDEWSIYAPSGKPQPSAESPSLLESLP